MKYTIVWLIFFVACYVFLPPSALAHGGGLDSRGGHRHTATNTYHCHRCGGYVRRNPTGKHPVDKQAIKIAELELTVDVLRRRLVILQNRINVVRSVIIDHPECVQ